MQVELVGIHVGSPPAELLPISRADAELENLAVAHKLPAAAQHTGVGELHPQVVVPQIGVGVKVEDVDIRVLGEGRPEGPQRHQVLATQQEGPLARF